MRFSMSLSTPRRRKWAALVPGLALVVGLAAPAGAAGTFVDDDTSVHEADIDFIAARGITIGCSEDRSRFCPDDPVTREEVATFLVRAFAVPASTVDAFGDDEASAHETSINAVAAAGIMPGCGDGIFCPTATVTREQAATILVATLGLVGFPTPVFTDVTGARLSDVNAIAGHGLTVGCATDGPRYCPTDPTTRAQMATFIARALRLGDKRAPLVAITSPADGTTLGATETSGTWSAAVTFAASYADPNGGTPTFAWTSSVDGTLGSGSPLSGTLTIPSGSGTSTPTIVVRATDAEGLFTLDSATVTVAKTTSTGGTVPSGCVYVPSGDVAFGVAVAPPPPPPPPPPC